jgi:hypothetical protein
VPRRLAVGAADGARRATNSTGAWAELPPAVDDDAKLVADRALDDLADGWPALAASAEPEASSRR